MIKSAADGNKVFEISLSLELETLPLLWQKSQ